MNLGSAIVLAIVFAMVGLALWRVHKKGAPCECGGSRKLCAKKHGGCCHCHD